MILSFVKYNYVFFEKTQIPNARGHFKYSCLAKCDFRFKVRSTYLNHDITLDIVFSPETKVLDAIFFDSSINCHIDDNKVIIRIKQDRTIRSFNIDFNINGSNLQDIHVNADSQNIKMFRSKRLKVKPKIKYRKTHWSRKQIITSNIIPAILIIISATAAPWWWNKLFRKNNNIGSSSKEFKETIHIPPDSIATKAHKIDIHKKSNY